jgi:PAS domain S-box-containing protein
MQASDSQLKQTWFWLGILAVVGVALIARWALYQERTSFLALRHTYERIICADELLSNLTDDEAWALGYVLTGDPSYMKPYNASEKALGDRADKLRKLVQNDPKQRAHFERLSPLLQKQIEVLLETVRTRRSAAGDTTRAGILTERGTQLMNQIRQIISEIRNQEQNTLPRLLQKRRSRLRADFAAIFGSALLAICCLLLAKTNLARNIFRRQRAEEELKASEKRFEILCEQAPIGIYETDAQGLCVYTNRWWSERSGLSATESLGRGWQKALHPDDLIEDWETAALRGAWWEYRLLTPRGDVRWIRASGGPIYSSGGTLTGFVGTLEDITERKQAERALRERDALNRAVLNSLPANIAVLNGDGIIQVTNEAWHRFAKENGDPPSSSVDTGADYLEVSKRASDAGSQEAAKALTGIQDVLAGTLQSFEMQYPCHSSSEKRWFHMLVTSLAGVSGGGAVITHVDVTRRKRAEERFRLAVEAAPSGMVMSDSSGTIILTNSRAEELFGYGRRELLGKSIETLLPELARGRHSGPRGELFESPLARPVGRGPEMNARRKDGTQSPVEVGLNPIETEEGTWVLSSIVDITQRKRSEEALRKSQTQLASDLDAMTRLQKLGTLFVCERNLAVVLDAIADAAIAISRADFGDIQLLDPASSTLKIVAQRGFPKWWIDFFDSVSESQGVCGTALERGERVIVEDVEQSPIFAGAPALEIQLKAGVRAVQSTPLVSRSGTIIGILSTHYRLPQRPDDRMLQLLDLLARQAAEIIERTRTEAALRESEERFRNMADTAPVMIWVSGPDKRCTFFNRTWLDFTGRTMEQELGYGWAEGLHPDDFDRCLATFNDSFDAQRRFRMEYRLRRTDGEFRWILDDGVPRFTPGGIFAGYIGSCIDLTEERRAEEERQKFVSLADRSLEFIGMCDLEFTPFYVNRAGIRLVGLENLEAACQIKVQDYFFPEDQHFIITEFFPRVLREGHAEMEIRFRHFKTGEAIWMLWNVFGIFDTRGSQVGFATVSVDITKRKRAERELRESRQELRALAGRLINAEEEERKRISRELHDDLNQKLALLAFDTGSLCLTPSSSVDQMTEQVRGLQARVVQLSQDVRQISHRLHPSILEDLGLTAALNELCEEFSAREGIEVQFEQEAVPQSLPADVASCLYRVAQEALHNVLKHAHATRATMKVSGSSKGVHLLIHDLGVGFNSEASRVHHGLGIVSMKERIRLVQGEFSIHSQAGQGTQVRVFVPLPKEES